jgi:O-antigen/teichoic acid export membrane protein
MTIQVFTGLAGFVSGGGMGQALVRAKDASRDDYNVVFTLQLCVGAAIYLAFFTIAPAFGRWYGQPLYADLMRVSALSFILRPFVNLPTNILFREMRFKAKSLAAIFNLVASNSVAIGMGLMGYGVWSLAISGLAAPVMSSFVLCRLARWSPRIDTNWRRARDLARYGMLVSANDILAYLRQQTSTFILSRAANAGTVGLFNRADSLAMLPHKFVAGSVYEVLFRALSKAQDELDLSRYLYLRSITLVGLYAFPLFIGLGFLAEPLVLALYGEKWRAAAGPISILVLGAPFMTVGQLAGAVLAARNALGRELAVQLVRLAVTAIAILLALPRGLDGVAAAMVLSSAISAVLMHRLAARTVDTTMRSAARALVAPAAVSLPLVICLVALREFLPLSIIGTNWLYVLTMSACGAATYVIAFLVLPIPALASEATRWKARVKAIALKRKIPDA